MARSPLQEVQRRIQFLHSLSFDDASARFDGFLAWMESEPATLRVLTELRQLVDAEKLMEGCNPHRAPMAKTPEDVARLGLFIFEYCREHPDHLPGLLFTMGCHDSYHDLDDDFRTALGKFINPFLNYLQTELQAQPAALSLEAAVQFRRDTLLDESFAKFFPGTARLWGNLSKEMTAFTDSENWFNIANSCREVMKQFAQELLLKSSVQRPEALKAGDVKGLVRHMLSTAGLSGRSHDALADLVSAAWDYTQAILHNKDASRAQAVRAYLWTGMVIAELATIK
jgi:hypothetical protein